MSHLFSSKPLNPKPISNASGDGVRVFVGADRSQLLAVKVLSHSIQRHTQLPVKVHPMVNLPVRVPKNPLNWQRTGFSFSRFCIPALAGYQGRALYLDADMIVFADIASLWHLPFNGAKVIIQEDLPIPRQQTNQKLGAPAKRVKQCAVMLLNCDRLDWDINHIIDDLDRERYDYAQLMNELCILPESDIEQAVPFHWNSLEHYEPGKTALLHYTDMATQPWVYANNQHGALWLEEIRQMLSSGALTRDELKQEIALGYCRPSLMMDLDWGHRVPSGFYPPFQKLIGLMDKPYRPHREVYRQKKIRLNAAKGQPNTQPKQQPEKQQPLGPNSPRYAYSFQSPCRQPRILILVDNLRATYFLSFHYALKQLHETERLAFFVIDSAEVRRWTNRRSPEAFVNQIIKDIAPTVVIFSRYALPYGDKLLTLFKAQKISTVYHVDDDLLHLHSDLGEEIQNRLGHPDVLQARQRLMKESDLIYTSTVFLRDRISHQFRDQTVFCGTYPPYLDCLLETPSNPAKHKAKAQALTTQPLTIGYMGSKGHQLDLEVIVPSLQQCLTAHPALRFETFGTIQMPAALKSFGSRIHAHKTNIDYASFLNQLNNLNWDIGLIPLQDTLFNRCRSATKFIEYTICGIPALASRGHRYDHLAQAPDPQIMTAAAAEWTTQLEKMIGDYELRQTLVRNAQVHCATAFRLDLLEAQIKKILALV